MRKDKDNFGKAYEQKIPAPMPELAASHTSIVMIETMLYQILSYEIDSLAKDERKRTAYFSKLFDAVAGREMRELLAKVFVQTPPKVIYGYARQGAELPCVSIILEEEEEDTKALGNYMGESVTGEAGDAAQFRGSIWQSSFALLIYAEHPTTCAGFYQIVKAILVGAVGVLESGGLMLPHFSGGELAPDQKYIPENVFTRVLRVRGQSVFTVPEFGRDPARFTVKIHADDVIVDGTRGGVHAFVPVQEPEE